MTTTVHHEVDWTVDPDTGRSNSSPMYNQLVGHVNQLILSSAYDLINGRSDRVAGLIVAQLAHKHNVGPLLYDANDNTVPSINPFDIHPRESEEDREKRWLLHMTKRSSGGRYEVDPESAPIASEVREAAEKMGITRSQLASLAGLDPVWVQLLCVDLLGGDEIDATAISRLREAYDKLPANE